MPSSGYSYKDIDEILTGRLRLAIVAFLMTAEKSDFSELLSVTEATKGNLGAQIQRLEDAKYIKVSKGYIARRTHMTVSITARGKSAFISHIEALQRMVDGNAQS